MKAFLFGKNAQNQFFFHKFDMFLISKYPFGFLRRLMGKINSELPEDVSAFSGFSFSDGGSFVFSQGHQILGVR